MSENKIFCPINSHPKSDGMCQKGKCAWWTDEKWGCAIQLIAYELSCLNQDSPEKIWGTGR